MRMTDCDLDVDAVQVYPPVVLQPEPTWTGPRDSGAIPMGLYDLYRAANCFSLGSEPPFLCDPDHLLFAYFKNVAADMKESFEYLPELLGVMREAESKEYTPIKLWKGEQWDQLATLRLHRAFKALIIELGGLLDQFCELAALFFSGLGSLVLGRSQFTRLYNYIKKTPAEQASVLKSPKEHAFELMVEVLRRHIFVDGPQADWLDVFLRFRNKAAHIGQHTFHTTGLRGGGTSEQLFTFLPNTWPRMLEQHVSPGPMALPKPGEMREWMLDNHIQQDLIDYSESLVSVLKKMIGEGLDVLLRTFVRFRAFPPDGTALTSLKEQQSKRFTFRHFA